MGLSYNADSRRRNLQTLGPVLARVLRHDVGDWCQLGHRASSPVWPRSKLFICSGREVHRPNMGRWPYPCECAVHISSNHPMTSFFSSTLFSIIFMLLHRKMWDSLSTRKRLGGRPEWLLNPIIAHRDERDQRNRALVRVTLDGRASSWHDQTHAGGISQVHPTGKSRNHDRWPCKTTTTMMIQSHTITYTEHPGRDAHVDWSWGCKFTTTRNTRIRIDIDLIGWGLKRET